MRRKRATLKCREADSLVWQWRQGMAVDNIVQQVLIDHTLDEAIEKYGEVVDLTSPLEPLRGQAVYGYANAVVLRCRRERQLNPQLSPVEADHLEVVATGRLDRAQSLLREMFAHGIGLNTATQFVEVLLADWDLRARPQALSEGLAVAHEGIRRASRLDDAVRSGVLTAEDVQNAWAEAQIALARVLAARPPDPAEPDETEATAAAFRSACQSSVGQLVISRGFAHEWGRWALQRARWDDAIEAFSYIESELRDADHGDLRPEEILSESLDLTSVATDLALARGIAGRPEEAIEGLEAARGLLWGAALSRRRMPQADLTLLRPVVEDLTRRMPDATLAFLVPGSVAGVALVARHGEPIRSELLSELTATAVELHLGKFDGALKARRGRSEGKEILVIGDEGLEDLTPQAQLDALTSWLWDAAMRRVMAHTGDSHRLVLVPTGMLVAAPLHAAWRPQPGGHRRYVIDDMDVIYLPTAAMAPSPPSELLSPRTEILIVQEPRPAAARRLDMAETEAMAVARAFPNASVLAHEQATRESVLDALAAHRLAHLICHGRSDPVSPLNSHLLMSNDEQIRVEDLLERDLSNLRLAVLSACESASASTHLPEAVVSLPAALLAAGVGGVLGTLWEADDATTALMMAAFYRNLADQTGAPADPARALSQAQLWMRDSTNAMKTEAYSDIVRPPKTPSEAARALWQAARTPPLHWAGFIYSGL
jgi:CHAT domain-containing protein